ncbi:MAG: adenine phosphoribosyltransferase [Bacteroidetes bacterium]|nr:adenine phosphoribosyltransferase [Bacteroidota bacterium]
MRPVQVLRSAIRTVPNFPKPGIQFKDITPILSDIDLLKLAVEQLALPFKEKRITKVIGVESRGFIMAPMIALELGASFIPVRKEGKLPRQTRSVSYDLEYGSATVEMHIDSVCSNDRILIHDDVLATGGTAAAVEELIERSGGKIIGLSFLIELSELNGRAKLKHKDKACSVVMV